MGALMVGGVCATHGLHGGRACPKCRRGRQVRATARKRGSLAERIRSGVKWKTVKARILERDGRRCTFGLYLGDDARGVPAGGCRARRGLDVHHLIPIEDGGEPYDDSNLRTLCSDHHATVEQAYNRSKEEHDGVTEF